MQPAIAAIGSNLLIATQIKNAAASLTGNRLPIQVIYQQETPHIAPPWICLCPARQAASLHQAFPQAAIISLDQPAQLHKTEAAQFLAAIADCCKKLGTDRLTMLPAASTRDATGSRALQGLTDELAEIIDLIRAGARQLRLPRGRVPAKAKEVRQQIKTQLQELATLKQKMIQKQ